MVKVVDSQGRGVCVEAKYSLLEISVPPFFTFQQCIQCAYYQIDSYPLRIYHMRISL